MKSPADCIGQYIRLRDFIAVKDLEHKSAMAPYHAAMETLENHMTGVLAAQAGVDGKASIATAQGTCFRKLKTAIKVLSREDFMDFVFDGRREGFITNHVPSEAVKEYIEQFKSVPPGLDVTSFYQIQFNSPKEK
jgi:hypothetical protein